MQWPLSRARQTMSAQGKRASTCRRRQPDGTTIRQRRRAATRVFELPLSRAPLRLGGRIEKTGNQPDPLSFEGRPRALEIELRDDDAIGLTSLFGQFACPLRLGVGAEVER